MAAKSDPDFFKRIKEKESEYNWDQGKTGAGADDFTKPGYGMTRSNTGNGRYKSKISPK
jgi:hypothetical protein